jgi:hypothetical protein
LVLVLKKPGKYGGGVEWDSVLVQRSKCDGTSPSLYNIGPLLFSIQKITAQTVESSVKQ